MEKVLKTYPELSREDLTLAANFKATQTPVMEHFESYLLRFEANEYIQSFRQLPIATIAMYVSSGNNAGEYWRSAMQDYVKAAQHIEKFASENPQVSAVQWARTTGNTYAGNGMAGKLMDSSNLFVEEIALRPALKPFLDTYNANPDILQNATPTDINIAVSQERLTETSSQMQTPFDKKVREYVQLKADIRETDAKLEEAYDYLNFVNRAEISPDELKTAENEFQSLQTRFDELSAQKSQIDKEYPTIWQVAERLEQQQMAEMAKNANLSGSLNDTTQQKYEQRITDLNSSQSPLDEPKNFAKNSENINQDTQNTPDKSISNIDNKQKAMQDLFNISDYKTFQEKVLFAAVPETEISKMIDEIAKSRTYLAVDFDHKDQAKAAGAKYDPQLKGWYAEEITPEIRPFLPQQPEILTEARKPYSDLMAQAQKIGVDLNSQNFKEEFDKWVRVPLMGKGVKNTDGGYKLFRNDDGTIGACVRNHSTNDTSHWNDRLKDGKQIQGKVPLPDYLANQKQKEWNTIAKHTATKQVAALRSEVATKAYHQLENAKLDDPYIQKKGIENIGKLKRLDDGSTVVPLYHNGKIANLQMIPAYDSSQKRLMTQAEKMGSYYAIGNGKNPSMVIVAEGMATADSVHQIATKLYGKDNVLTLSAIDSGNLANVAAKVQQNFPTAQKVIAADNDAANEQKSGKNAGLQAAIMVTHDYKDFQVAICPILADDKGNFKNTDWNDYLKAQGKEQAVRAFPESLNGHTAQKTAVKSLEQMTPQQNKTQGGMEL